MPLSAPQQSGDMLAPADILNHTLVVTPVEFIEHIQTVNTKAGEKSPAIRVNVVDFSTPDNIPVVYNGVLWFNVMLYNNLKRQIGETILGRMVTGTATPGRNAPFQLQDVMSETAWVQHVEAWLETPEGQGYELQAINDVNTYSKNAAANANQAPVSAPPAPPQNPVQAMGAAPGGTGPNFPTGPVGVTAPSAPPAPQPVPASPAPSAPAGATPDLAAMLASLPAEQQAAVLANLQNQGQASS